MSSNDGSRFPGREALSGQKLLTATLQVLSMNKVTGVGKDGLMLTRNLKVNRQKFEFGGYDLLQKRRTKDGE